MNKMKLNLADWLYEIRDENDSQEIGKQEDHRDYGG
jgi:hypothetical protein